MLPGRENSHHKLRNHVGTAWVLKGCAVGSLKIGAMLKESDHGLPTSNYMLTTIKGQLAALLWSQLQGNPFKMRGGLQTAPAVISLSELVCHR
jgi:hypothetical protein